MSQQLMDIRQTWNLMFWTSYCDNIVLIVLYSPTFLVIQAAHPCFWSTFAQHDLRFSMFGMSPFILFLFVSFHYLYIFCISMCLSFIKRYCANMEGFYFYFILLCMGYYSNKHFHTTKFLTNMQTRETYFRNRNLNSCSSWSKLNTEEPPTQPPFCLVVVLVL